MATNTNPFYTYSATAGSSKTLQKPQDGGDNNQWGNYINTDLDEIVSAVNALSDKIADASENTLVDFTATTDAVNHVGVTNAAAGSGPTISTAGTDSNVDLNVTPKGTGDSVFTNKIKVDDVIEKTTDHGVEIDGVLVKDGDVGVATISSKAGTSVGVTLGTDDGDDFNVGSGKLVVEGDTGDVGLGLADPEELLHLKGTEAVIKLEDSAVTGEGFIDFDGSSLQLNTHRNPNTGANPNSKAPASIILSGNDADSSVKFYTKASNSGAATERMAIDKDGSITTPNGEFNGTIGSSASFPTGHIIQVVTDTYVRSSSVSHNTTRSIDYGSNLSVTIQPSVASHKIILILQIPDINNGSTANAAVHIGIRKSTDGFAANDTQFGEKEFPWAFVNYTNTTDNIISVPTLTTIDTLGGTDTFTIRPTFKAQAGTPTSFTNASNAANDVATLIVMEIKS